MSYRESASLTAGLLAAKGTAAPATDLYRFGQPLLRPPAPEGPAGTAPGAAVRTPRAPVTGTGRVKVSLRLDPDQHRHLRLLAAHLGLSRQALLERALDSFGATMVPAVRDGSCVCLAPAARRHEEE